MIIDDFYFVRIALFPDKTNPPLIVDADAMLTNSFAAEKLQTVAGRRLQV
jgi:hypothetical protein